MRENSIALSAMNSRVDARTPTARQWQADALLVLVTFIWGSTFVLVKQAVARFPVYYFLALRFGLATLVLVTMFGRRLRSLSRQSIASGVLIGLFLFGGYAFQTFGLRLTTASKAGFITGLSVVIVPLLSAPLLRRAPSGQALAGVALCTAGLALLSLGRDLKPSPGDLLVLGCAVCFALHIVSVSKFAPRTDALALTIVQVATVALLSAAVALGSEAKPSLRPDTLAAGAFTGVLATALAFGVQNTVQTRTTATHTALIFASEPAFAAVFGFFFGERLTRIGWLGCGLILAGMLVAEVWPTGGRT